MGVLLGLFYPFCLFTKSYLCRMFLLTEYAHAAGCGCKIAPATLHEILGSSRNSKEFQQLLVGNSSNDDAAVWDIGNGMAVINTVDFFMPIVDDAFQFGRIAAANAISDVYAMGGKPLFANAILGWPIDVLPVDLAAQVMAGAKSICELAGIPIAGGHSVDAKEPLFGLSVCGSVQINHITKNNTAKVGDLLFLTKALGTGIAATAQKRKLKADSALNAAIDSMCTLNSIGAALANINGVNAMTDITGFGLIGHLIEMCEGSQTSAKITSSKIKAIDGIDELLLQNCIPDNTYRNWNAYEKKVSGMADMRSFQLLNDPQTSGGLLISIAPESANELIDLFNKNGLNDFIEPIGMMLEQSDFSIYLEA
jgi:selenide,water dikinase